MSSHDLRHLLLALTAVGVLCVLPIALGAPIDLLLAAPVLLLALPLLAGRYLGEETLDRLARVVAARRRPRTVAALLSTARGPRVLLARGGALLARSLAVRPPPAAPVIR
ncbi:hypothetical protein LRS13_11520 [Svornostia abyssi]|uniref:Uncharacterized protein n=1 Tax=Svornostia abyssi TaxID=2898438 RepID=A0ABY5PNE8_9ACTN|nr:hypothetical protein LRS13_11520 [Parviterribacteraceae bacterium J379]